MPLSYANINMFTSLYLLVGIILRRGSEATSNILSGSQEAREKSILFSEDFLRRAKQREPSAWASIYEEFSSKIYRYVFFKVGNRHVAEDITEMVFLRGLESIDKYEWRGLPFSSWLFRIAHNLVIDQKRKGIEDKELPLEEAFLSPEVDLESRAEKNLALEQVVKAMKNLTGLQREVIELRFGSELSTAEIARILGKNEGAIKALQHSAILKLREILKVE